MVKFIGDISYFAAIVGINAMLVFLLTMTKWRKDSVSIAITVFFGLVALILDLSALMLFVEAVRGFILSYIRTPLYIFLAVSVWTLVVASFATAIAGKRRRGEAKVDIAPPQK